MDIRSRGCGRTFSRTHGDDVDGSSLKGHGIALGGIRDVRHAAPRPQNGFPESRRVRSAAGAASIIYVEFDWGT